PYVYYVGNNPREAQKYFHGIREAVPHFKAIAIFDRTEQELPSESDLRFLMWNRREIENYLCYPETLLAYARKSAVTESPGPLFKDSEVDCHIVIMQECIGELEDALNKMDKGSPWNDNFKVSDDFLVPLFKNYFKKLKIPNVLEKKNFHELAYYVPKEKIDPEVKEKLDMIVKVAKSAQHPSYINP
ncbi:MAG: AAA family ATPase, partial [bacterium]